MNKLMIFALTFLIASITWASPTLQGEWSGQGTLQVQNSNSTYTTEIKIKILFEQGQLRIQDCWVIPAGDLVKRTLCNNYEFSTDEKNQIFSGDQKVGQISNQKIIIFKNSPQFSEQMLFKLSDAQSLRYRYTLISQDGEMMTRSGDLTQR